MDGQGPLEPHVVTRRAPDFQHQGAWVLLVLSRRSSAGLGSQTENVRRQPEPSRPSLFAQSRRTGNRTTPNRVETKAKSRSFGPRSYRHRGWPNRHARRDRHRHRPRELLPRQRKSKGDLTRLLAKAAARRAQHQSALSWELRGNVLVVVSRRSRQVG